MKNHRHALEALAQGKYHDPFSLLGPHRENGVRLVRTLQAGATAVTLLDRHGVELAAMRRVHKNGLYEAILPANLRHYRLRIETPDGHTQDIEDPYRFPPMLGDIDLHLLAEGSHREIYKRLGAQTMRLLGVKGTGFAVWAPNAARVSVVGDFNGWNGCSHVMRLHPGSGIWEIFIPSIAAGCHYKFEILDRNGRYLPLKSDPMAHYFEPPPGNASIVYQSHYRWSDQEWLKQRKSDTGLDRPISIYEVHLGSWRRRQDEDHRWLSYRELAVELVEYVLEMGFTHIELLPVSEHPFDGSWGYQPIGMYAPTRRFGEPDDFRTLVDRCHQAGIGVIVDWVPAHFPRDEHGLGRFDGTALYEHEDPRKGEHADWGTLIFNFGRAEVVNYLIGSALYWIDELHVDALRVDAVASMLYLDYSRKEGEWVPNEFGGNENLEAVEFLKQLNFAVHERGASCYAEESTAWPGVSHPTENGGLGFTYKWNMGWMNDSLSYMGEESLHRKHHHDRMTFGLVYAFSENFILPLSHDEVVHGKRSLLGRMPGDEWQQFANLRAYYGFMFAHPGKKLLFMGDEIAQKAEWNHDAMLDWHLLDNATHAGIQSLVTDLNHVYRQTPALFEQDFDQHGFEWIEQHDADNSIFAWIRRAADGRFVVCISNFTPVVRHDYRIGVPAAGRYRELLNTDALHYGGSGVMQPGELVTHSIPSQAHADSLSLTLPPLTTLFLEAVDTGSQS
jgi:1,4-alpha-glucan branching enzyme